jgi:hypothetical protein
MGACIIAHMDDGKKYSETLIRHPAQAENGHPCEILERVTYERELQPDGSWSEPRQVNRRYDLRTGQRVNHLDGDRFEVDVSGEAITRLPA